VAEASDLNCERADEVRLTAAKLFIGQSVKQYEMVILKTVLRQSAEDRTMTVPDRIIEFLNKNKDRRSVTIAFQELLNLARRQQAQQTSKPLGATASYTRISGRCSHCGDDKVVTTAKSISAYGLKEDADSTHTLLNDVISRWNGLHDRSTFRSSSITTQALTVYTASSRTMRSEPHLVKA